MLEDVAALDELDAQLSAQAVVRRLRWDRLSSRAEPSHPPRPSRPGLLARVLVANEADHLPLHRQVESNDREAAALDCSTLTDWIGKRPAKAGGGRREAR